MGQSACADAGTNLKPFFSTLVRIQAFPWRLIQVNTPIETSRSTRIADSPRNSMNNRGVSCRSRRSASKPKPKRILSAPSRYQRAHQVGVATRRATEGLKRGWGKTRSKLKKLVPGLSGAAAVKSFHNT